MVVWMSEREVAWERIFACELDYPKLETSATKKCRCGNDSCKHARKIKCVCRCHSLNHGIEQRRGMEPLEKALGIEKGSPEPLGDHALNLELAGRFPL
jgi:hypothetical protein